MSNIKTNEIAKRIRTNRTTNNYLRKIKHNCEFKRHAERLKEES